MPRFKIHHVTRYSYEVPVVDSANQIMLFPLEDVYQDVLKHDLMITGEPVLDLYHDYYGNKVGSFMYTASHKELVIDARMEVVTHKRTLPVETAAKEDQWNNLLSLAYDIPYIDFLKQEKFNALSAVQAIANAAESRQVTVLKAANLLNDYVYTNFQYIKGVTTVETTLDEIWQLKAGVCQDFAHILLAMLRMIDIPARYVSGYVCPNRNGMRGEGATHAWVEAYIPFYGWLGFDPTNNCIANELHVRLAVGRSFMDCSPVKGTYKGTANHRLDVGVSVAYEDGVTQNDAATVLTPQPVAPTNGEPKNSWRQHMEMMQQQQQQ
ncbi:transglutaminase family protein [Pseudoflavitalea sp. X16]|uniref:transglutaminase family protein n=1 Tax=Paraflavitalea devenefica TaxID=2716334 RepID=UPI001421184B|nr:transglutaminase family protein [Paraflavitalea devenefica]NII29635.1 transglutaminase family protein [Paraflavitalea devenefica]